MPLQIGLMLLNQMNNLSHADLSTGVGVLVKTLVASVEVNCNTESMLRLR